MTTVHRWETFYCLSRQVRTSFFRVSSSATPVGAVRTAARLTCGLPARVLARGAGEQHLGLGAAALRLHQLLEEPLPLLDEHDRHLQRHRHASNHKCLRRPSSQTLTHETVLENNTNTAVSPGCFCFGAHISQHVVPACASRPPPAPRPGPCSFSSAPSPTSSLHFFRSRPWKETQFS